MSQCSDTKVASQRCYMHLFNEKLTESTAFGDHNLVHSIRTVACTKKYPCTVCHINCGSLDSAMHKKWATLLLETSCYTFNKHCKNYGSTKMVLNAPIWYYADSWVAILRETLLMLNSTHRCDTNATWMCCLHPNHHWHAVCHKGDRISPNQQLRAENQHSNS